MRRLGATALYVTHDHVEAMTLADRIAVMRTGRLLQLGTPREVYERPATSFVGAFLGHAADEPPARAGRGRRDRRGTIPLRAHAGALPPRVDVGIRPEHVRLGEEGEPGEVVVVEPLGAESHVLVRVGALELRAQSPGFDARRRGDAVGVSVEPSRLVLFEAEREGRRLA